MDAHERAIRQKYRDPIQFRVILVLLMALPEDLLVENTRETNDK